PGSILEVLQVGKALIGLSNSDRRDLHQDESVRKVHGQCYLSVVPFAAWLGRRHGYEPDRCSLALRTAELPRTQGYRRIPAAGCARVRALASSRSQLALAGLAREAPEPEPD